MDLYLHNFAGDALGTDVPSVRVIGVSTLSSRHQTDPIHLMWSFGFIFPAAFGCHSFPQAAICLIRLSGACVSQGVFENHYKTRGLVVKSEITLFVLLTSIVLLSNGKKISSLLKRQGKFLKGIRLRTLNGFDFLRIQTKKTYMGIFFLPVYFCCSWFLFAEMALRGGDHREVEDTEV